MEAGNQQPKPSSRSIPIQHATLVAVIFFKSKIRGMAGDRLSALITTMAMTSMVASYNLDDDLELDARELSEFCGRNDDDETTSQHNIEAKPWPSLSNDAS